MDAQRFDDLSRTLAQQEVTRRGFTLGALIGFLTLLVDLIRGTRSTLATGTCNELGRRCSNPEGNYTCCEFLGTPLGCRPVTPGVAGGDLCCVEDNNPCDPNWRAEIYDNAPQCCNLNAVCSTRYGETPVCKVEEPTCDPSKCACGCNPQTGTCYTNCGGFYGRRCGDAIDTGCSGDYRCIDGNCLTPGTTHPCQKDCDTIRNRKSKQRCNRRQSQWERRNGTTCEAQGF